MLNYIEYQEQMNQLKEELKQNGEEKAIETYLQNIADKMGVKKFPNGLSVSQCAKMIRTAARKYTDIKHELKDSKESLNEKSLKQYIITYMKDLDEEQAVQYLAILTIIYRYMNYDDEQVDVDTLQREHSRLICKSDEYPYEQKIQDLLDELDLSKMSNIFGYINMEQLNGPIEDVLKEFHTNYLDYENAVLVSALTYGEVVQGKVEEIPSEADCMLVSAQAMAQYDALMVSLKAQKGEIPIDEANVELSFLSHVLTVTIASCVAVVVATLGITAMLLLGYLYAMRFKVTLGLALIVAVLVAGVGLISNKYGDPTDVYEILNYKLQLLLRGHKFKKLKRLMRREKQRNKFRG